MQCETCGTEILSNAVACYHCGRVANAEFVQPIPETNQTANRLDSTQIIIIAVAAVGLAIAIGYEIGMSSRTIQSPQRVVYETP